MAIEKLRTPSGAVRAALLAAVSVMLGWAVFETMVPLAVPAGDPLALRVAPANPDVVLDRAMVQFTERRGDLPQSTITAIKVASQRAPLDGRPFMFLAVDALVKRQDGRAVRMLEAGRRMDPRQRWTRLLLLDRYLRSGQYREAATEMAVLARLVSQAGSPILAELARLSAAPETRDAVRAALAYDSDLEQALLVTLARAGTSPEIIFDLASARGKSGAGAEGSWGPALIATMVKAGDIARARAVWNRIYNIPSSALIAPIYDIALRGAPGTGPFNWTFGDGTIGVVDRMPGKLQIEYYGRASGELASQLILLSPGRYRFAYTLAGVPPTAQGASLAWTLSCADTPTSPLTSMGIPTVANVPRRIAADFTIPAGCRAQWLRLVGNASEFPVAMSATIERLSLQSIGARP